MATPLVYTAADVSRIIGLPCETDESVPEALDGEIVIWYGGWELAQLRSCKAGKSRMWPDQDWYDRHGWKAESGYYRLTFRVPGSHRKTWEEQFAYLKTVDEAARPAPVAVAATALLVHLAATGTDLLEDDWCRCTEPLPGGYHAVLTMVGGRVNVRDYWDGRRRGFVWLASSVLDAPRKS